MSSSSLLKYEIVLHNPTGIYKPGDQVTGHVALKILEDIPLHGESSANLEYSFYSFHPLISPSPQLFPFYGIFIMKTFLFWIQGII